MSCPNYNFVLNCAGSPRRFSSRDCKMKSVISYRNWPENPIMTFFPTYGVLLDVRNRKKRCHAWSLIAMTSHVQTLCMLFFQDSTGTSNSIFIPSLAIQPDFASMSPTPIKYNLAPCYHQTRLPLQLSRPPTFLMEVFLVIVSRIL
jgi:hypothetical protein